MQINVVFDASTNGAPAGFFTAVNAAVQYWDQEITNPISVTIDVGWGEVAGTAITGDDIGESSTNGLQFSYAQVRQALVTAATSPADVQAVASLPLTDPTGGAGLFVPVAEAAALGLTGGAILADAIGAVGLNAGDTYTFDPSNRAVSGAYDAIGGLEHEISEVLGRIAGSGQVVDNVAQYAPLDLFRYTGPNSLALTPEAASFSIDGGRTLLTPFNAPSAGDPGDWDSSVGGDSFGEAQTGVAALVSAIDLAVMDVLGYSIAATPGSTARFPSGDFALSAMTSWSYDTTRGLIYFATTAGLIESFDPATDKATALVNLGQFIQGLAVSPDGSDLYVGMQGGVPIPSGGVTETMDLVNLSTLAITAQTYAGNTMEAGPASIVIAPDGTGYFTSAFGGSGFTPLRTFSTSQAFTPAIVSGADMIGAGGEGPPYYYFAPHVALSANAQYALAYDTDDSDGAVTLLDAQTGTVIASKDVIFSEDNDKADVSSAGLVVDLTYNNLEVFNSQLSLVKDFSAFQSPPGTIVGVLFSQDGSELYLWDSPAQELLVYSSSTWQQTGVIPLGTSVSNLNAGGNPAGEMSLADNGRILVLNTGVGFQIIDLRPGEHRYDLDGDGLSHLLIENAAGSVVVGTVGEGAISYAAVGGLGPEWKFEGAGDLLGDGKEGFLIENTAGAVVAGEVSGGQTAYTNLTALGPEWKFVGDGDFLGAGHDQFLIENTSGAVVVGNLSNGQTAFTQVAALGPEWSFHGAGDFLGDGKDQFLIENGSGAVVVGEVQNGAAVYTDVGGLGPEWKFVGVGDFLGDGKDDFLIENTAGAIFAGEVVNGQASFTQLTGLGSEWKFVGAGDYLGEGHDQFLIENTAGAVVIGDWTGGAIHFTQVAALGPEWAFH